MSVRTIAFSWQCNQNVYAYVNNLLFIKYVPKNQLLFFLDFNSQRMLGKKNKGVYLCKMQVECMTCGKIILNENQQHHIKNSHNNKVVKFKIYNDAKQPKLMFPKARIDNSSNNNEPDNSSQKSPVIENTDESSENDNQALNNNVSDSEGNFNENPDNPELEDQNKTVRDRDNVDLEQSTSKDVFVSSKPNQPVLEKYNPNDYKRDFLSSWYKKHP